MFNKKNLLIASLIAPLALSIFMLYPKGEIVIPLHSEELFAKGNYQESLEILDKSVKDGRYYLHKAYIFRELGDINSSDESLKAALNVIKDSKGVAEIHLNFLYNSYLNQDQAGLKQRFFQARKVMVNDYGWLPVFYALLTQSNEEFHHLPRREFASLWMEVSFNKTFTPFWFDKHRTRAFIDHGEYEEARMTLDEWKDRLDGSELTQLMRLYSESYALQSENKSPSEAFPLLRGAAAFGDDPRVMELAFHNAMELLNQNDFTALSDYINLLEEKGSADHLEGLAVAIAALIQSGSLDPYKACHSLSGSRMCGDLEEYFNKKVKMDLSDGNLWRAALAFSSNPDQLINECNEIACHNMLESLSNGQLQNLEALFSFYIENIKEKNLPYPFSRRLLDKGEALWKVPQKRGNGLLAFEMALELSNENEIDELRLEIEDRFLRLQADSFRSDRVNDMHDLLAAADLLKLTSLDKGNRKELESQLDDAELLYGEGRLDEAEDKAEWALKIDPQNERAKRLLGMIAYYYADYEKGLEYLKGLKPTSLDMKEALAVMLVLNGEEEGSKLLQEAKKERPLQDEVYLRLAFGFYVKGKPSEALGWIEKIEKPTNESIAGQAFGAFQIDSWAESLELMKDLPVPFSDLDGFKGITIEAMINLGDVNNARKKLDDLLNSPPQPEEEGFNPYFIKFKELKLDEWNRNYVAALYYKEVDVDLNKALIYFNKLRNPTPVAEIEKAETLLRLNREPEAKGILLSVRKKLVNSSDKDELNMRILPLLGEIFSRLGDFEEAWPYYQEYYEQPAANDEFRSAYAKVLMKSHRFDLALLQYKKLAENQKLSAEEAIGELTCLVHLERFSEANKRANQLIRRGELSLALRLKLARLMIITQNTELLDQIIVNIPEPSQRNDEDNRELLLLWINLGNFNDALELAQLLESNLIKSAAGSMALAELYVKLGKLSDALEFAEKALDVNPLDPDALIFIEAYTKNYEVLAKAAKLLKERHDEEPENISLTIEYCASLIDLSIESYLSGNLDAIEKSEDLKEVLRLTDLAVKENPGVPKVWFLRGKASFLLGDNDEAVKHFNEALKLDPSYIEALQHLALVREEEGEREAAVTVLKKALVFDPANPDLWSQLSETYEAADQSGDAIEALQNALKLDPFEQNLYLRLGLLYLKMENPRGAVEILDALLSFEPQNVEGLKLMLRALFDPNYKVDADELQKKKIEIYDRLKFTAPDQAQDALPPGVNLDPKGKK